MAEDETHDIIKDVKNTFDKITEYSEGPQWDLFLNCYDDSPAFLHFSSDGKMKNYEESKRSVQSILMRLKNKSS